MNQSGIRGHSVYERLISITGGPNECLERLTNQAMAYPASFNVTSHEPVLSQLSDACVPPSLDY